MRRSFGILIDIWKKSVRKLKAETYALYLAYKHPQTPWYAKVFTGMVVAYALSPIDLVPDFIPILGYFDDLILVPLGIVFALKLIPAQVMTECRTQAQIDLQQEGKPVNWFAPVAIIAIWISLATLCVIWVIVLVY
ncbi:MAG: YkvA family protein [Anaerolineales bacterium]